nr:amino acid adenylation domain-containing protein [Pseudonocardia sp. AL041005-10]
MSQFGPGTIPLRPGFPPRDPFGGVTVRTPAAPGRHAVHGSVLTGAPPAPPRTLWDVFIRTVADHPHAPALDTGGVRLDYAGLRAAVERTAARLAACGVGRGDRVGIRVPSGTPDLYVAILAVLRRGAAYVPVDADDPHERARTVFTEASVCAVVETGGRIVPGPVHARRIPSRGPDVRDDAWVIFTSGSTGTPKGVAVTHRSAAAFVDAEARLFARGRPLGPGDRVLAGLSVAFDASCEEMWLAWRHGACLVPAPRALVRSGAEFGDRLVDLGITVVSTVPTLAALWTAEQLRAVRLLILGGEACPEPLAHRLARACPEVWNTYGPTEATVVSCAARLTEDGPVRIGLPLAGWQLAVVDPATGVPVGAGEVGELLIAGVGTARYLDRDKDRDRFSPVPALGPQRAYRSGDLVRADPEGLGFVGRADGQVKIRGFRVELSEIESVLADLPGIAAAAVTVHEVRPSVPELVAYYCTGPGLRIDDHEVAAGLRSRLPAHMLPAFYEHLPALPTTTSGKVDRTALPAPSGRGTASSSPVVAPATPTEAELAALLGSPSGSPRCPWRATWSTICAPTPSRSPSSRRWSATGAGRPARSGCGCSTSTRRCARSPCCSTGPGPAPSPLRRPPPPPRRPRWAGRGTWCAGPCSWSCCCSASPRAPWSPGPTSSGWTSRPACSTCSSGPAPRSPRRSCCSRSCRCWRSGCSSGAGGPGRSRCGARRTCGSGSSPRWCGPARWCCSPGPRSICCTCARSAPGWGAGLSCSPGPSRSAPT